MPGGEARRRFFPYGVGTLGPEHGEVLARERGGGLGRVWGWGWGGDTWCRAPHVPQRDGGTRTQLGAQSPVPPQLHGARRAGWHRGDTAAPFTHRGCSAGDRDPNPWHGDGTAPRGPPKPPPAPPGFTTQGSGCLAPHSPRRTPGCPWSSGSARGGSGWVWWPVGTRRGWARREMAGL